MSDMEKAIALSCPFYWVGMKDCRVNQEKLGMRTAASFEVLGPISVV